MKRFSYAGHSPWETWTTEVYRTGEKTPEKVTGMRAEFKLTCSSLAPGEWTPMPVRVFIARSGAIWAGPRQTLYVETDAGIVGLNLKRMMVFWTNSLFSKQKKKNTLDETVQLFESNISADQLVAMGGESDNKRFLARATILDGLDHRFFYRSPENPVVDEESLFPDSVVVHGPSFVKILAVQITCGELRLDLQSPGGHYKASVWIDMMSKKLQKIIQDGKQVFPK